MFCYGVAKFLFRFVLKTSPIVVMIRTIGANILLVLAQILCYSCIYELLQELYNLLHPGISIDVRFI